MSAFALAASWWFWVALAVLGSVFAVFMLERDRFGGLFIGTAAVLVAVQLLTDVDLVGWVVANPWKLVYGVLGYFVLGVVWCRLKWRLFVAKQRDLYEDRKRDFLSSKGLSYSAEGHTAVPEDLKRDWTELVKSLRYERGHSFPPKPAECKGKITGWIAWWPWSLGWTLLNDPLRRLVEFLYRRIVEALDRDSKRAFEGTEGDLVAPPQPRR